MGRQLAAAVDGLLEPLVEDRFTAADALDILSDDPETASSNIAADRNRWLCKSICHAAEVQCYAGLCCAVCLGMLVGHMPI